MDTDILVPTLHRPHYLEPFLTSLAEHTANYRVMWIIQDGDHETLAELNRLGEVDYVIAAGDPATSNQKVNIGYRATTSPFFFIGSDDIRVTAGWLDRAYDLMVDEVNVVGVCDSIPGHMHDGELPGHVLIRRSYIEEYGTIDGPGVLHEGYHHFYSDLEFWQTAKSRGRVASAFDARITHLHPNDGSAPVDSTTEWSRGFLRADMATFAGRQHLWTSLPPSDPYSGGENRSHLLEQVV